jgi:beta-glucanase (GH16 family)
LDIPSRPIEISSDVKRSASDVATIFDDEFSGHTLPTTWSVAQGSNQSNAERECYRPGNVSVSGGFLNETAVVGRTCGAYCPPTSTNLCPFISGGVQWANFSFTYGTVTVRAKFAGGIGAWPAIWLLGSNCQQPSWLTSTCDWPSPGSDEIDIAEILGSNDRRVNEAIHTEDSYGSDVDPRCEPLVSAANKQWHTYSLIWAPDSLTWKIDGVQTCQMTTSIPTTPMFLIINTAVGGTGAGRVEPSTLPQTTEIDYVRVTQP